MFSRLSADTTPQFKANRAFTFGGVFVRHTQLLESPSYRNYEDKVFKKMMMTWEIIHCLTAPLSEAFQLTIGAAPHQGNKHLGTSPNVESSASYRW